MPPASLTSFAVSFTLSLRSTAISFAPSFVNSNDAARPIPLPAPVMTTDLPSSRPIELLPDRVVVGACRLTEFQTRFQTSNALETTCALTYSDGRQY
jgi:hypothetical protein